MFPTGYLYEDSIKVVDLFDLTRRELVSLATKFGVEGIKANQNKARMVEAIRSVPLASAPEQHR